MARITVHAANLPQSAAPRPATVMQAVRVNGVTIPEAEIGREAQYHPAASLADAWRHAATALVVRELLSQRCDQLGLVAAGEEERIEALLAAEVTTPDPDEASCRRWYEQNRARLGGRDFAQAREIVAAYLRDASWTTACGQYVRVLIGRARIEGVDLEGAESPLLQ